MSECRSWLALGVAALHPGEEIPTNRWWTTAHLAAIRSVLNAVEARHPERYHKMISREGRIVVRRKL